MFNNLNKLSSLTLLSFNLFQNLGGHGPFQEFPALVDGDSARLPDECCITQAHFLGRHGERYPTFSRGIRYEATLEKIKDSGLTGPLEFLNNYTYFIKPEDYGYLTSTGPFNGVNGSVDRAIEFKTRYRHLIQQFENKTLPIFTASSSRVVDTARLFAQNLGLESVELVVIPESHTQGANSLTPDRSCHTYNSSSSLHYQFFNHRFHETKRRLNKFSPNVFLSSNDIRHLIELCAFEITATGKFDFCSIFTDEEHILNGYSRALRYFYRNGPGNGMSSTLGSVYANATLTLLKSEENNTLPLYISFSHDTHINCLLSSLGVFSAGSLSPKTPNLEHPWVHGDLTPMGASVVFEKVECGNDIYVRLLVNNALVPLPNCSSGPGLSCPLPEFTNLILQSKDYVEECQLEKDLPQYLSFYWDWDENKNKGIHALILQEESEI